MKLSRDLLKKIVKEELEQEGFFGKLKAKIAPGMASKSIADRHGIFTVQDGMIEIDPSAIRGNEPASVVKLVTKRLDDLFKDEDFRALPNASKYRVKEAFEELRDIKISNISGDPEDVVADIARRATNQSLKAIFKKVKQAIDSGRASERAYAQEKEDRARRDRNEYEREKNAKLDAELARQADKERFDREMRASQYEPPESRAARPEDRGGRSDIYSGNEYTNKSVRDAWEESKKLTTNDLVKLIKEEFKQMMKETEQFPTDYDKDQKRKNQDDRKDYARDTSSDEYWADIKRDEKEKKKKNNTKKSEGDLEEMRTPRGGSDEYRDHRAETEYEIASLAGKIEDLQADKKAAKTPEEKEKIQKRIDAANDRLKKLEASL